MTDDSTSALGAYAEYRSAPAEKLVKIPEGIDFTQAAAMMLQGMTARFLVKETYPVKWGDTILVHAAAGGVASILVQWAKHLGATVIGLVSTPEKAELARKAGARRNVPATGRTRKPAARARCG